MISTYCKLSGMPLAVAPAFSDFLRSKLAIHPIFSMELPKLLDMANSVKLSRLSYDENYLLGLALLKTTDLVHWREPMPLVVEPSENAQRLMARFASHARDTAIGVAELRRLPKQVATLYKDLPLFHVTSDTTVDCMFNWSKVVASKAALYIDTGKARRRADSSYALAMYMVDDSTDTKQAKKINREYELPQVYDADIGIWAYDRFCDEYSAEVQASHESKFKQVYDLLVHNKTGGVKGDQLQNLSRVLHEVLPLDTPYNQRCAQLVLAYLDKVRGIELRKVADTLGESLTTETRTVGNQSWSYVVLATGSGTTGAGSGTAGATIAHSHSNSVKGGGSAASPKGRPLNTVTAGASIAQSAPSAAPQRQQVSPAQLAKLRARLARG